MIESGTKLGPYEIVASIGAGGQGEVYRGRDSRLNRDVAIKVLPESLSRDSVHLARFQREAQLLAALNHPNIAAIYGVEERASGSYLVLEMVEGATLAEKLRAGALPMDDALGLARQLAEALEAAHDKGITHRDLKPANLKITPEGKVKVLDFGLAKDVAPQPRAGAMSDPPTLDMGTQAGALLGTAAYMSPEQARGKQLDKRTDIWSFGCVLYEMLTGKQAFAGETITDILGAVVNLEPDWRALPRATPVRIRDLLRRCLTKDSSRRLRDMGDARIEIDEVLNAPRPAEPTPGGGVGHVPAHRAILLLLLGVLLGGAGVWSLRSASPSSAPGVARLVLDLPPTMRLAGRPFPTVALSPDGTRIAFVADRDGKQRIYLRSLDGLEPKAVPGTEGATTPFFSPNGQWLAFFDGSRLKKVAASGGAPATVCGISFDLFGASWGARNTIAFAPAFDSALWEVAADGGVAQPLTVLDETRNEVGHHWPDFLPGGRAILFTAVTSGKGWDDALIELQSLETGQRRVLVEGGSYARYVPTGHLVYVRAGTLLAVPFDLNKLEVTGPPVPVVEGVTESQLGVPQLSFSGRGDLVYLPGGVQGDQRSLVWVDRAGASQPLKVPARFYNNPRLSPDGKRLAVWIAAGARCEVAVCELSHETWTRLTFDWDNHAPVWSAEGDRVIFGSVRGGSNQLFSKPADGGGPEEQLTRDRTYPWAQSSSPDGKMLVFQDSGPDTGWDIWLLPHEGDGRPRTFLQTAANEGLPAFSPDGRFLAYVSDETGPNEVYVQPYPGPGGKWQLSTEGGTEPVWAALGRELFYREGDRMMAVEVTTEPAFSAAKPRLVFQGDYERGAIYTRGYDVTPDGRRFLMMRSSETEAAATEIQFVTNWFEELKRRVPAGRDR